MREFRISEIGVEKTLAKAQKLAQRAQKKGLSGGYQVRIEKRFEEIEGISHEYQVLVIEGETSQVQWLAVHRRCRVY
jgi:predicted ester cyclase